VVFHGTIAGFGAGTGAAFALIPAQNATGNWIKVVQRVPVRIALDPKELRKYPLRLGLSMKVEVDTAAQANAASAATLAGLSAALPTSNVDAQADALIRRIVTDNLGKPAGK
jgi:membrane fusion protein (multidrug efflux system)